MASFYKVSFKQNVHTNGWTTTKGLRDLLDDPNAIGLFFFPITKSNRGVVVEVSGLTVSNLFPEPPSDIVALPPGGVSFAMSMPVGTVIETLPDFYIWYSNENGGEGFNDNPEDIFESVYFDKPTLMEIMDRFPGKDIVLMRAKVKVQNARSYQTLVLFSQSTGAEEALTSEDGAFAATSLAENLDGIYYMVGLPCPPAWRPEMLKLFPKGRPELLQVVQKIRIDNNAPSPRPIEIRVFKQMGGFFYSTFEGIGRAVFAIFNGLARLPFLFSSQK